MINKIKKIKVSSFDVETDGLYPYHGNKVFSYCIGWPVLDNLGNPIDCRVEVRRLDNIDSEINKENWKYLQDYFKNISIVKIAHNFKFELAMLKMNGIHVPDGTVWHDTMIMSQVLRNLAPSHALDYLCWELCGYSRELDKKVKLAAKASGDKYNLVNVNLMTEYQIADGERPILLYYTFIKELMKDSRRYADYLNEIEVVKVTQWEESNGIYLSYPNIDKLVLWMESELDKVQRESYDLLKEYVNLNSDEQVRRILFRKYKMPVLKFTDSDTPKPSTDKDTLFTLREKYDHPILDLILKQRSYTKGLATIKGYLRHAKGKDHINPNINSNAARTSRKTSNRPNMQNVSADAGPKNPFPVPLRKCFRAQKGSVLLPVDYDGIEMRLIVNNTGEPELLNLMKSDPAADIHYKTVECFLMDGVFARIGDPIYKSGIQQAKELKETDLKKFKTHRKAYKGIGFCIAYGGGLDKVAVTLQKTVDEIKQGDSNYRYRFSRIAGFTQDVIERVRRDGFITTSFGRKLYVQKDKPYIGANYEIQGTAAGILKRAQVKIYDYLKTNKYLSDIKMILDVHDEIIFQYPRSLLPYKDEILPEISLLMIDMPEIEIPLRVSWSISTTKKKKKKDLEVIYA